MIAAQNRIVTGILLLIAAWVCWISFYQKPADAFLFPRLISVAFLALAAWTFAREMVRPTRTGSGISFQEAKNFAPGLAIAAIHVFVTAKALGFYASSTVAFLILYAWYDPAPHTAARSWVYRLVATAAFAAVMYGLFSVVLRVYTPRGILL